MLATIRILSFGQLIYLIFVKETEIVNTSVVYDAFFIYYIICYGHVLKGLFSRVLSTLLIHCNFFALAIGQFS